MQGTPQEQGIYRRTFRNYFEVIRERGSDWKYKLSVALLEVYNDEVLRCEIATQHVEFEYILHSSIAVRLFR